MARPVTTVRRADVAALGVFVALGLLVMGHYLAHPADRVSAHLPDDNTWFEWLLSHGAYSVRHLSNPLFSVRQNAPTGVNMMANTSVLGVTIPLAPLTMLLGPEIVYVAWIAGACAATAATTYWALARYLVRSRVAAFAGAALAGFAPGVIHHANGQPNFVSNFLLPLIVVRVLRLSRPRDGLGLGLLVTWQVFINEEMLLVTAAACAVAVLARARPWRRSFGAALGVAGLVTAALCAYPLWMQFAGPQSYQALPSFHSWGEDVAAYVTMPRDSLGGVGAAEATVGRSEQNTWFGWPLTGVALALTVALWRTSVAARVATVVAAVFAVASLGPRIRFNGELTGIPGPWAVVPDRLPVLGLLMPSRLSCAVVGAVAVLVALGWDRIRPAGFARWLIAAALVPLIPTPVPAVADQRPPRFITSGAWHAYVPAGATLVPVPLPDNSAGRSTLGWSAAAQHAFPVPRGYFLGPDAAGNGQMGPADPSVTVDLVGSVIDRHRLPVVDDPVRTAVRAELAHWHASVVVLGPHPDEAMLRQLLDDLLGPGRRSDDVWLWPIPAGAAS